MSSDQDFPKTSQPESHKERVLRPPTQNGNPRTGNSRPNSAQSQSRREFSLQIPKSSLAPKPPIARRPKPPTNTGSTGQPKTPPAPKLAGISRPSSPPNIQSPSTNVTEYGNPPRPNAPKTTSPPGPRPASAFASSRQWDSKRPHMPMPKNSLALKPPSTSRSRSTPSISVASVGQQGLSTPSPVPQPKSPRTLRLSLIPTSVDNNQLRKFLGGLEYESQPPKENILALSLAPFVDWLVATVSFSQEPLIFLRCTTGRSLSLPLPPELGGSTINVDCDFYGITPLYHPPSKPTYDVIAVSGLSSHAFGSWKSPQNSHVMWLRDILQLDFPDFRVLTWGYESDLRDGTNDSTIADFSRQLLTAVHTARDDDSEGKTRPVVFVGHDLGGLIIKHALVEAAQGSSEDDQAIMRCCVGIFLFGVPNRGLNNGYLLSLVKGRKNEALVQNLMESSALLNNLHIAFQRSYKSSLKYCFVASFFETRDTNTVVELPDGSWSRSGEPIRVVTRESATGFAPEEEAHNQIAIVADHSKLVQFKGRDDANYLHVRAKLKEMVRRTPKILQMRTGDGI